MQHLGKRLLVFFIAIMIVVSTMSLNVGAISKFPKDYIYSAEKNEKINGSGGHIYLPVTYIVESSISYVDDEYNSFS